MKGDIKGKPDNKELDQKFYTWGKLCFFLNQLLRYSVFFNVISKV